MNVDRSSSVSYDVQLEEIRKIITSPKHELNVDNDTYVRRLQLYPEFLLMPYWFDYYETQYMLKCPYLAGKILDFGCGSGHMDVLLARSGKEVHGLDLSTMAIDIGNYLRSLESESVQNLLSFKLEDVTSTPETYHEFDCCMSTHVFEHILDPGPVIEGIRKRVKPNSYMIISVPLGYAYNDPGHVHHFMDADHLKSHFKPYVDVVKIDTDTTNLVFKGLFRF